MSLRSIAARAWLIRGRRHAALGAPPVLERRQKARTVRHESFRAEPPLRAQPQRGAGRGEQHARLAQRTGGGTVEQQRIALRMTRRQTAQYCGRNVKLTDQGRARGKLTFEEMGSGAEASEDQ